VQNIRSTQYKADLMVERFMATANRASDRVRPGRSTRMTVLFIGPLPDPITGQALACRVFLDRLPKEHRVDLINLSKRDFRQGFSSLSRAADVIRILWRIWRRRKTADFIYLTVSESLAGNVKDLLIYLICFGQLSHMVIHLLGGASMRGIMLGNRGLLRDLNAFFLKRLGGVVVEGETQVAIYRNTVSQEKIHVVPNFAEDSLFTSVEWIDSKFFRPRPLRVLFLSNLLPGKGHEELVDAFFALDQKTRASIEIDLAGGFESEDQKEKFLNRVAGVETIRYHGTVAGEGKRKLFHRAHVFCLPTYYPYEGQPLSILEAYASGCAVITTDHSGIRDVFHDEVNGFEVAMRSVVDVREAIERAVAQPECLHRMAITNLKAALERHRTDIYARALVTIVERVARSNDTGGP
jgi:glycosyltransferase involved in cell wall biosynthesis